MAGLGRRTHYRKYLTDSVLYDYPEPTDDEVIAKVIATRGSNQFDVLLSSSSTNTTTVLAILPSKFRKLIWLKRNDYIIVKSATMVVEHDKNNENNTTTTTTEDNDDDQVITKSNPPVTSEQDDNHVITSTNSNTLKDGIGFMITHILYKDQVKHLVSKGLWPTDNLEFGVNDVTIADNNTITGENTDGIVYNNTNTTNDHHLNDNRNVSKEKDNGPIETKNNEPTTDSTIQKDMKTSDNVIDNDNESYENDDDDYYNDEDDDNLNNELFVNTNRINRIVIQDSSSSDDE